MTLDWDKLRAAAIDAMRRAYAPYSKFPVGAAGTRRRRADRRRVQRGERVVRPRAVRRVRHGLGAARQRRWPSRRGVLCGRRGRAADAVRALPAAALGAWRPGLSHRLPRAGRCGWPTCCRTRSTRPSLTVPPVRGRCRRGLRQWHGGAPSSCIPTPWAVTRVWTAYWERSTASPSPARPAKPVDASGPTSRSRRGAGDSGGGADVARGRPGGGLGARAHAAGRGGRRRGRPELGRRGRGTHGASPEQLGRGTNG